MSTPTGDKTMIKAALILMCAALGVSSVAWADDLFEKAWSDYSRKIERAGRGAFYSSCEADGKGYVLLFPVGETQGMLIATSSQSVINMAPARIRNGAISLNFDNTQGGVYTYSDLNNRAAALATMKFNLASDRSVATLVRIPAKDACPGKQGG